MCIVFPSLCFGLYRVYKGHIYIYMWYIIGYIFVYYKNVTKVACDSSNGNRAEGAPPKFFKLLSNWRHLFDNDVIISSGRAFSGR